MKEKKYIWEINILITQLSTVVLTVDGMTETLQGYFSPKRRKWILISNELCVRICTHLHKHKHALEVLSLEWRLSQSPQSTQKVNIAKQQAKNMSWTSQLYTCQYKNMQNKLCRGSPLKPQITLDTCHAQKNRGIRLTCCQSIELPSGLQDLWY